VTPCAARLVAPIRRVARPATAPSVQREIFIRGGSLVEWILCVGISQSPTQLRKWSAQAVRKICSGVMRRSHSGVTTQSPCGPAITRAKKEGRIREDNLRFEREVGEIPVRGRRPLLEHRQCAPASPRKCWRHAERGQRCRRMRMVVVGAAIR
jgi:hypothetical protein